MRGRRDQQATMLAFVDLEERVPKDHPLRTIKTVADEALDRLSPEFDRMYSKVDRASVPPRRYIFAPPLAAALRCCSITVSQGTCDQDSLSIEENQC